MKNSAYNEPANLQNQREYNNKGVGATTWQQCKIRAKEALECW